MNVERNQKFNNGVSIHDIPYLEDQNLMVTQFCWTSNKLIRLAISCYKSSNKLMYDYTSSCRASNTAPGT